MIITRTPYRISFFGGGTDYHTWYEENGGEVLSTSINHYNYISCRYLPPFHPEYKNRISWKILEYPDKVEDIKHNAIRGALQYYGVNNGVELSNQCDLPARSGLGSSSSFCAGLIKAIKALKGEMISKEDLAKETIHLERVVLKENGGIQDQIAAVYGGLNHIVINHNGSFSVDPVIIGEERRNDFNNHLLLFFTGVSRTSSDVCKSQVEKIKDNSSKLTHMQNMVKDAVKLLSNSNANLDDFGKMLHETWMVKRSLTDKVSSFSIDEIYELAVKNGATGGKILGAGGGGFILFFAKPQYHTKIKDALNNLIHVPFKIEDDGCKTVLYTPSYYDPSTYERRDFVHMKDLDGKIAF